jgi:hypothetical protein
VVNLKIGFPFAPYPLGAKCCTGGRDAVHYQFKLLSQGKSLAYQVVRQSIWRGKNITWLTNILARFPTERYLKATDCRQKDQAGTVYKGWWEPALIWLGIYTELGPNWNIQETAVWQQEFAPASGTKIDIQYQPLVGRTSMLDHLEETPVKRLQADRDREAAKDAACLDEPTWQRIVKRYREAHKKADEARASLDAGGWKWKGIITVTVFARRGIRIGHRQ